MSKRHFRFKEFSLRSVQDDPYLYHDICGESVLVHPTEGCAWNLEETIVRAMEHKCPPKMDTEKEDNNRIDELIDRPMGTDVA